ncbi:MAG: sodium/glucose cotransporter [Bacteroidetes bacterium HGW-Bacteroidetes-20]|nr:MAG: sodium/glucose cotransporter [Bacteroidetes bacterium HGW-Bacteroidetes-20]
MGIGLFVSRQPKGIEKNANDYFLASKSLPWWAVGASLIAANISAEQFIGMSGSGFKIGLGIATYEWMSALTLVIIAIFFIPIYLKKGVFTMPQFLEQRFDKRVKVVMAIFWLAVFVFINLTSILYLGALAVHNMFGISLFWSVIFLALFAMVYSIYGGLKAVAWTDVVQVFFLVGGGLVVTWVALSTLGEGSFLSGVKTIFDQAPEKFDLILDKSHPSYIDLPGIGVLIGGMWVANLYYWGCNQYIIQRALAAKNVHEAQKGLIFAGFLKLLLPLIVVIPGIAAFLLAQKGIITIDKPDNAYPVLLNMIPQGVRGLAFAALVAAILSSLASMMNSISTIFTMDIYNTYFSKNATEKRLVNVGRISAVLAMIIAVVIAPLLTNLDQAFQYIQEFTGFISPGALAIFLTGFFYKKATANGALAAALGTFVFSALFKFLLPEVPFLDRMGYVFLISLFIIWLFAKIENKPESPRVIQLDKTMFTTSKGFKWGAAIIVIILIVLYALWW